MSRAVSAAFEDDELAKLAVLSQHLDTLPSGLLRALVCAAYDSLEQGQGFEGRLIHHCVELAVAELSAEHLAELRAERAGKDPTP